jgi:hypothetical protein
MRGSQAAYQPGSVLRAAADAAAALPGSTPRERARAITAAAVRTRAVHVRGVLSGGDITELDQLYTTVRAEELKRSQGKGDLFDHPNLTGLRDNNHHCAFLHVAQLIDEKLPHVLEKVQETMRRVDREQGWGLLGEPGADHNVRVCEYHEYTTGGEVCDPTHSDGGSLVTSSVMLTDDADFTGGEFTTLEADEETATEHSDFQRGDALVLCV